MEQEKEEKFETINVGDCIEYFGVNELLGHFSDMELINELTTYRQCTVQYRDEIIDNNLILSQIKTICRELQPKGYIDKEDAKKLMCEYIDTWMNHSF